VVVVTAAAAVLVGAATLGVILARSGPSPRPAASYGQIPSWLPKARIRVGRLVSASAAHPWLAIQGDTVSVGLAGGRVLATAVGPMVPEEGRFPVPATTPCTFTVTLRGLSGRVALRAAAFTILDELGRLHRPVVTGRSGGPPPAWVAPGQTVTLRVRDVLPTGGGRLRWAPEGPAPIVSWDFDVEID
jgi:hypothetical protein